MKRVPLRENNCFPGRTSPRSVFPIVILLAVGMSGCIRHQVGPRLIPTARMDYNTAISSSWDQDLLLNLVRLRYRDSPLFVDIASITASYTLGRSASAGIAAGGNPLDLTNLNASGGLVFNENPVISYRYLQGEEFSQRLLSPLAPVSIQTLSQSGWSIQRLLLCCVQSINGIENAVAAAGPTPDYVPNYEQFQQVAALFRRLQIANHIIVETDPDGTPFLRFKSMGGADAAALKELLHLDMDTNRFQLVIAPQQTSPTEIAMQGRSLLSVMFFLSQGVLPPAADSAAGMVTVTRDANNNVFDWSQVVGQLIRVHSGDAPPAQSAVQVQHRGHWFWIDDNDLNSKTTLSLLRLLLFLKSGENGTPSPLITIPTR